jgi:hypothetical protein
VDGAEHVAKILKPRRDLCLHPYRAIEGGHARATEMVPDTGFHLCDQLLQHGRITTILRGRRDGECCQRCLQSASQISNVTKRAFESGVILVKQRVELICSSTTGRRFLRLPRRDMLAAAGAYVRQRLPQSFERSQSKPDLKHDRKH